MKSVHLNKNTVSFKQRATSGQRRFWQSSVIVPALIVAIVAVAGATYLNHSFAATVKYVTTSGSDSNPGTQAAPYRTIKKGLTSLAPGDTLMVGGGTYSEDVTGVTINGSSSARITVKNISGQRPVIAGLFWFTGNYVTFDGINVTWRSGLSVDNHMMKFNGGTGWRWTNSEIWGSKSWANILITGSPNQWSLDNNRIHNADGTSHTPEQDHNIYINTSRSGNSGVIERNLIYNAPRGQNVKFDGTGGGSGGGMNITVRYNTLYNSNRGMLIGGESQGNDIHHNIINTNNIGFYIYQLSGSGNKLYDNIFYGSGTYKQVSGSASGVSDTNNKWGSVNPQLDASMKPQNSAAAAYGYHAAGGTVAPPAPTPTPTPPTPSPTPTPTPTPPTPTPPAPTPSPTPVSGDANGDSRVNALDLSILIVRDGQNFPAADFNRDGRVGAADMSILLSRWTW